MNFNSLEEHGYLGYLTSSFIDKNIDKFAQLSEIVETSR